MRDKRRQLGKMLFLLILAGCSSSGGWFHREEPKPGPLANQASSQTAPAAPQGTPNRGNLSPAASAAAPAGANASSGELMDGVTESCNINCSPNLAARFKPKWCACFKEPI